MKYRVTSHLRRNGKDYAIGSEIELDPAVADKMPHAVEVIPEQKPLFEVKNELHDDQRFAKAPKRAKADSTDRL
jgi:hypothetical protein